MGHKIFVSYKYSDNQVKHLSNKSYWETTTVRDYVDILQQKLEITNNINKGEQDNEDLSNYSESTIWEKLKDRIFDSSITIVLISPNMRESYRRDSSQWIPWEISFSLKETKRNDRTSHSNAMIAIVLPDTMGSYSYFISQTICGAKTYNTHSLFKILRDNMFNCKKANTYYCYSCRSNHYYKDWCSYIDVVTWDEFLKQPNRYIEMALERQYHINDYTITKEV